MNAKWLLPVLAACGYQPARFANKPVATAVADDKAIPMPRRHAFISELYDADVYVRRELVNAMDPRRDGDAVDVNALDQVPASSWTRGEPDWFRDPLDGYRRDGPPQPPLAPVDEPPASDTPGARVVRDARGLRYELLPDVQGRPGMRTGAAAVASRLVWALGYHTPEVYVLRAADGRYAATRWPVGADLGPTPIEDPRPDDPNDVLDHRDRRTLRALKLVCAWLDLERMPPRVLRDAYVGAPGKGHVRHFIVGLDGALGVDRYFDALQWLRDDDREESNFFLRLFSLGLSPKPSAYPPETPWPSVGLLQEYPDPEDFTPAPPFEPIDRLQPADVYWAAKRIAALGHQTLADAVAGGEMGALQQNWLFQMLSLRRGQLVAWGYDRVTPLEAFAVLPEDPAKKLPPRLLLVDYAVSSGMITAARSRYRVRFLGGRGQEVATGDDLEPAGARVVVPLPAVLQQQEYAVVQVTGLRDGAPLPRPVEVHLRPAKSGFTIAGVRH